MLSISTINSGVREQEEYYSEDESLGEDESLNESESQSEYYSHAETQSETHSLTQAVWYGQGALKLGLEGNVTKSDFKDLFYGFKPGGAERIRGDKPNSDGEERLGHDLTFSAPKSVSMALHLGGNPLLFDAHMEAVKESLFQVETRYAQARIQVNGDRSVVNTNNLTIALIPHHTSRDGDMQLHTHAFVMNGTERCDGSWRALWHESLIDAQWLGSLYRQKLAHKVEALGYSIYKTKDGFELKGIDRVDIEVFSKRSRSIVKKLEQLGQEVTPENRDWATLTTRKSKHITQKLEEFQQGWMDEAQAMGIEVPKPGKSPVEFLGNQSASTELESALAHLSQRSVSFSRENIYQYVFNRLQSFELEELDAEIEQHSSLIRTRDGRFTTVEALEREIETIGRWMNGQGTAEAIAIAPLLEGTKLNSGQAEAIRRFLTSNDTHQIIHGLSGVGKTTALGELKRQLEGIKIDIRGFSPTIEAAAELQKELKINTGTVENLVLSQPDFSPNQLWIIDEAGMIGARQLLQIGRKADATGARILLVGDKGQNSSVEAGSPLRSLITHGATTHSISQIIRQQNSTQKQAVELIADGNGRMALELLNEFGYVSEIASRKERVQEIAAKYLALSEKERSQTLIVTGTNAERLAITNALRQGLKLEGSLDPSGVKTVQLVSRQLTHEQARRIDNYQIGNYIRLHREYKGTSLKKDQLYKVEKVDGNALVVSSYGGRLYRFNPSQYKDKEVFYAQEMEVVVGESLRWTSTNKSKDRINGQTFTVTAIEGTKLSVIDKKGNTRDVSLMQPLAVDYDLVSTSYRAQGKTAKRVIVSATSDPTSSREPFYVKISRQTKELSVYTQDLQQLEKWVSRSNAQLNPLELLGDNHDERDFSRSCDISGYSGSVEPDGAKDQQNRQQVQSDSIDYTRAIERLCDSINRTTIAETIGRLGAVVDGVHRLNQQLHRGAASRNKLTREVGRLSEQIGSTDRTIDRAKEERLAAAIQQRQISESIEKPLLGLRDALGKVSYFKPVETRPLIELAQTLQQSVAQSKEKAARTIQDEKLKILADAIALWKADSATTASRLLQSAANGINALKADESASVVLKAQIGAESINRIRAEDYITAALLFFNQTLSKSMESVTVAPQRLDAAVNKLHSILGQEYYSQSLALSKDAPRTDRSPTPKPCKLEVFWQPHATPEPPSHIDPKHWREWIEDSCIHPAIARARLQTISYDDVYESLLSDKLATMGSGQFVTMPMARLMKTYEQLALHGGWWVDAGIDPCCFPMLQPGEKPQLSLYGTFKPNNPRLDQNGKIRKYENPLSLKQKLFERSLNFSPVPDEIAERIYQKYGITPTEAEKASGFWYVVYKYPQIPIYRTEGNKKDAAITSQGRVVISGQGVNAGYRAKNQFGYKLPQRVLHPQLELFAQREREFRFAFDCDSKLSTILNVRQDLVREAELLQQRGCNIYCLQWDSDKGKGADDLIKNCGPIAFEKADAIAVPFEQIARLHYRTKYNSIAKCVKSELGNISSERVDLEVYIRAIASGDNLDGFRFVSESDTARSLRRQEPKVDVGYVKAIALVAGTYKRMSDRNVENLDELIIKTVERQTAANAVKDDLTIIALDNSQVKNYRLQ